MLAVVDLVEGGLEVVGHVHPDHVQRVSTRVIPPDVGRSGLYHGGSRGGHSLDNGT